jgi:hypothetical protein
MIPIKKIRSAIMKTVGIGAGIGAGIGYAVGSIGPFIVALTMKDAGQTPAIAGITGMVGTLAGGMLGAIVGAIVIAFRKLKISR